jgi:hypothetical protein
MRDFKDHTLKERLGNAAQAKAKLLERVKAMPSASDPAMMEKRAAREEIAAARLVRAAAKEQAAKERLAKEEADRLEQAARAEEEARIVADQEVARAAEKKAERDARYAARKKKQA